MFKVRTYPSVEQIYNLMIIQCKVGASREKNSYQNAKSCLCQGMGEVTLSVKLSAPGKEAIIFTAVRTSDVNTTFF